MGDPKLTQIDIDLQEIECALRFAKQGRLVIWGAAQDALNRLIKSCAEGLPKDYEAHL
jgi:hypothetical protein